MRGIQNFIKEKRSHQTVFFWTILVLLIIILQIIQIASLSGDAQTVDEGPHLLAGYAYLKTGKILINPEHPPLIKAWAALPLLVLNPDLPIDVTRAAYQPAELDQWSLSGDFLYHNRVPADAMLFWAHIMMLILLTAAALVVALVARHFFGDTAGLIAFVLFAFEPTVLAHGRIVTTDIGVSAFIFLAIFSFYRLLESPTMRRALYAGIFLALALLSKFSALILIPIFILLWLIRWLQSKKNTTILLPSMRMLGLAVLVLCGIIWLFYGLNIERPSHDPKVQQLYERRAILAADPNAYEGYPLAQFIIHTFDPAIQPGTALKWLSDNAPVPAYRYFRGLFDFLAHNYQGHVAYLLGHIYQFGIWQYFPIAYLIKTPIPMLIFILVAVCAFAIAILRMRPSDARPSTRIKKYWGAVRAVFQQTPLAAWALLLPPAMYVLSSLQTNLNLGIRHLLPIYAFVAVGVAGTISLMTKQVPSLSPFAAYAPIFPRPRKIITAVVAAILLGWFALESLWIAPYHLSYFNEIIGGPKNGQQYLVDSNIDWGQDFLRLKNYMREKNLDSVYLRYFGKTDWGYYGVRGLTVPTTKEVAKDGVPKGVVIMSVTALFLFNPQEFLWLRTYTPADRIGYSLWVYDFR